LRSHDGENKETIKRRLKRIRRMLKKRLERFRRQRFSRQRHGGGRER